MYASLGFTITTLLLADSALGVGVVTDHTSQPTMHCYIYPSLSP